MFTWFLRGVTPFFNQDSALDRDKRLDLELVAGNEIKTPSVHFNIWTGNLEFSSTSLGYKLYKVRDKAKFFWRGRYSDGWIGNDASLLINDNYAASPVLKLSSPNFGLPNSVTIKKNGAVFASIEITNTDELTVNLDPPSSEPSVYQFDVVKTVAPIDIGLNADTRKLGLLIRLEETGNKANSAFTPEFTTQSPR
jgi:hypothetical protein